ncbi:hypothetical protein EGM51_03270 [Verrucomicrobia bacterium S94]|nr:hypothetical protein EGM51_03270 [Verrucomicrobia bacterium S94]
MLCDAGLDLNALNAEQQEAYARLGRVLDQHKYVPVERLQIIKCEVPVRPGRKSRLSCKVYPSNAMRNGVIWESTDPEIAAVDKFGVLHAHQPGKVKVNAYSWDDAKPSAKNEGETYLRDGIQSSVTVAIEE